MLSFAFPKQSSGPDYSVCWANPGTQALSLTPLLIDDQQETFADSKSADCTFSGTSVNK